MFKEEANAKAAEWGVPYVETSAKTNVNVDKVNPSSFSLVSNGVTALNIVRIEVIADGP